MRENEWSYVDCCVRIAELTERQAKYQVSDLVVSVTHAVEDRKQLKRMLDEAMFLIELYANKGNGSKRLAKLEKEYRI